MSGKIEKCETVKVVREYGPPCFIGPDDKPQCSYVATEEECGLNLEGLPSDNPRLAKLFETARETSSVNILSYADALKMVLKRSNIGKGATPEYKRVAIQKEAARFMDDAKKLTETTRTGQGPARPLQQDVRNVPDRTCSEISLFDGCGGHNEAPICKKCSGGR